MKEKQIDLSAGGGQRSGSIDVLKILAAFLIVVSHFVPKYTWYGGFELCGYVQLSFASTNPNMPVLMLYNTCGALGNDLFLVSSAWFLLENKRGFKPKRIVSLELDIIILSLLWLVITRLFGYPVSGNDVIRSVLPVLRGPYWFFSCYVLFYFLHPAYNAVLEKLNRRQLLSVDLVLLFLYSVMQFVELNAYYFNPLVGFTVIYFITAYNKRFLPSFSQDRRANGILILVSGLCLVVFVYLNNFIGLRVPR